MKKLTLIIPLFLALTSLKYVENDGKLSCARNVSVQKVVAGTEFLIEIVVDKKDIGRIAKIEEILPEGITALESVETNNGSFRIDNKKVKFVWLSVPQEDHFKVSYKVKTEPGMRGKKKINGTVFYLEDNQPRKYTIPATFVEIKNK